MFFAVLQMATEVTLSFKLDLEVVNIKLDKPEADEIVQ